MYWAAATRYASITDYMSRDEFTKIGHIIHFNNNTALVTNQEANSYDRLHKLRPFLKIVRSTCLQLTNEECQCIDEEMIPFKGRNQLKQYIPPQNNKKVGFQSICSLWF